MQQDNETRQNADGRDNNLTLKQKTRLENLTQLGAVQEKLLLKQM